MLGGLGSSFLWPLPIRLICTYLPARVAHIRRLCSWQSTIWLDCTIVTFLLFFCLKAQPPLWRLDCRVSVHRIGCLHSLSRRRISGILDFLESDKIGQDVSMLSTTPAEEKIMVAFQQQYKSRSFSFFTKCHYFTAGLCTPKTDIRRLFKCAQNRKLCTLSR